MKIKVAKVESKPTSTGGIRYIFTGADHLKYSGFLDGLKDVKLGDMIDGEIKVNGQYNNIIQLNNVERGITALASSQNKPSAPNQDKLIAFYETKLAIEQIGECFRQNPAQVPKELIGAYWNFAREKLNITE